MTPPIGFGWEFWLCIAALAIGIVTPWAWIVWHVTRPCIKARTTNADLVRPPDNAKLK